MATEEILIYYPPHSDPHRRWEAWGLVKVDFGTRPSAHRVTRYLAKHSDLSRTHVADLTANVYKNYIPLFL